MATTDPSVRTFHAHLMDARTGETVIYLDAWGDYGWPAEEYREAAAFQWSENNYSCDCNRLPYFCRAKGVEEPEHTTCGRPLILAKLMHGDKVLFSDWIEDAAKRAEYVAVVQAERAEVVGRAQP